MVKLMALALVFLVASILVRIIPQKSITGFGYKTNFSTQNLETWLEGNKYCSSLLIVFSIIALAIDYILYINNIRSPRINALIILAFVITACILTDKHLRKIFKSKKVKS